MVIFRRFNCICTASGTVILFERPYVTLVKREPVSRTAAQREWRYQTLYIYN